MILPSMLVEYFKNKIITFDVDGVLAFSQGPVVDEINRRFNLNKSPQDLDNWHAVSDWLNEVVGKEKAREIENELWFNPEIIGRAFPIPGARNLIQRLNNQGATITVITGRPSRLNEITKDFILGYYKSIREGQIIANPFDDIEEASDFKPRKIAKINPHFHIEDSVSQTRAILSLTESTRVVMIPNGWNKKVDIKSDRLVIATRREDGMTSLWPVYDVLRSLVAQY